MCPDRPPTQDSIPEHTDPSLVTLRRSTRINNKLNTASPAPPTVPSTPLRRRTPAHPAFPRPIPHSAMEALTTLFTGMQEQLSSANCRVPKLNERNYVHWKRDMELYRKESNLWDTVTAAVPADITPDWSRKNSRALAAIHTCCEQSQQDLISSCDNAKAAWDKLKSTFATNNLATIHRLYAEFNYIYKQHDESMLTYITRVNAISTQLTAAGENVSTSNLISRTI